MTKARLGMIGMCVGFTVLASTLVRAGDDKKAAARDEKAIAAAHDAWDAIQSLEGTWVTTEPGPDGKQNELVFKKMAGGSMLAETMFPGSKHEMLNTYHMDGDTLMVTHYCAQGVQPRMKLVSAENGVFKFEFMDCTNLKPGTGRMGGLELTINGEQLIEKWLYLKDGQVVSEMTFELTKKS
jgi:hypothetical protein